MGWCFHRGVGAAAIAFTLCLGCGTHGETPSGGAASTASASTASASTTLSGTRETAAMESAKDLITRLRKGEPYRRGAEGFLSTSGAPEPWALTELADAIRTTPEPEREALVRLLAAIGRAADPLRSAGGELLRDPQVIALLVSPSLDVPGGGRDYALDTLDAATPAALLQPHGAALAKDLEDRGGTSALHVIAKAKPPEAKAVVDRLASSPSGAGDEAVQIAKAALGDAAAEKRFVDAFLATKDPKEKARLAAVLGRVGTRGALSALASEMRTPLVDEMPNVMRRSVRLDILAALQRNYPEEKILWENSIEGDEGYARAEAFCEATFGTKWKGPRPPYLKIQGFPSP
ncbi:MAG: hypothetical protein U0441_38355 [Polyangiaceae bacterium]